MQSFTPLQAHPPLFLVVSLTTFLPLLASFGLQFHKVSWSCCIPSRAHQNWWHRACHVLICLKFDRGLNATFFLHLSTMWNLWPQKFWDACWVTHDHAAKFCGHKYWNCDFFDYIGYISTPRHADCSLLSTWTPIQHLSCVILCRIVLVTQGMIAAGLSWQSGASNSGLHSAVGTKQEK